jgi:hypothetical protein
VPIDQSVIFHQALMKVGVGSTFMRISEAGCGGRKFAMKENMQWVWIFLLKS